jgi:hypothetical protein
MTMIEQAVIDRLNREEIESHQRWLAAIRAVGWKWAEHAHFDDLKDVARMDIRSYALPFDGLLGVLGMEDADEFLNATGAFSSDDLAEYSDEIAVDFARGVCEFLEAAQRQGAFQRAYEVVSYGDEGEDEENL